MAKWIEPPAALVFTTALNASTNVDHITDFSVVADTIQVDNAIFAALGGNGTLTADQFVKNTTGLAGDGNDHIIYETDTGWLTYDSNGRNCRCRCCRRACHCRAGR